MKKQKFAIHWQILIALILAVIYGMAFPTKHKVTAKSIEKIEKYKTDYDIKTDLLFKLESLIEENPADENVFISSKDFDTR